MKETLEEALKSYVLTMSLDQSVYIDFLQCAEFGAKWNQERMYSEEEVFKLICDFNYDLRIDEVKDIKEYFEQFKKK